MGKVAVRGDSAPFGKIYHIITDGEGFVNRNLGILGGELEGGEQSFLFLIGLLFISLAHPKETNQRKRA
jgi:hypothetical protein